MFSKLKTCMPIMKKQYASTLATNPSFNSVLIPSTKGLTSPYLWRNYSSQSTTSAGKYDYVVIGAGTAGCVMANRLAQKAGVSVLLLEAGRKDDYMWIHIPVGYLYCIDNPRTDWLYRTEAEAGLNGRSLNYTRGKGLGGCSSINGMIYMRGQARDYDQWAELTGDPSWKWQNVLPVFKKSEHYHKGADEFHGTGGEWRVDKQRLSWEILDKFQEAAEQTGIPRTTDFNRGNNEGCGYYEVNQKEGFRWNTAKAFLRSVKGRNGRVDVMTGCHVKRLRFENTSSGLKCVGVEFRRENTDLFAEAENETVLTAGAIGSPQILQLSGIGSAPFLRELGIPVVSDLPGVGENLQDHLQLRLAFKVQNTKTLNTMAASWYGKMGIGMEYVLSRSGPMSMSPSQLGAFAKSNPSEATPNLQYHIQPLSLERFGEPLHSFPAFTASVCNLRPTSRGHIRIASSDPLASPRITPNYLSTPEDREVAAEAISLTRRIVSAPALRPYSPEEFKPGVQYQTKEELVKAAGNIGTTIFHPIGTCKMGREDDPLAVVDTQLRVRGVAGLRVADASIMPTITSGNTNSPTIMIAERAAEFITNSELPPQKRVLQAGKTGTVQTA